MPPQSLVRRLVVPAVALAGTVMATTFTSTSVASAAAPSVYAGGGYGYGSRASLGTYVASGPTSVVSVCSSRSGTFTNSAGSTKLRAVGTAGSVKTSLKTTRTTSTQTATTTSTITNVNLLGGAVRASSITAVSTVKHSASGFTRTNRSQFVGLKVDGVVVKSDARPNTTISLAKGLGKVVLNSQSTSTTKYGLYQSVTQAVQLNLNASKALGTPAGTVTLASSAAFMHRATNAFAFGSAYATSATVANGTVTSPATAAVGLACGGSDNQTLTNSTAAIKAKGLVSTGAAKSSAVSRDLRDHGTSVTTGSKVAGVDLLNGLVKASTVQAQASTTLRADGKRTSTSSGTQVTGLKISGKAVTAKSGENTKITIANVGTLYLDRTYRSSNDIRVYGLQLVLAKAQGSTPAGSVITVGYARAGINAK